MRLIYLILPGLISLIVNTGFNDKEKSFPLIPIHYNLSKPDKVYELPHTLHEISGITMINEDTIACIQDENGIIYFFDISKEKLTDLSYFHQDGDYEGITRSGKILWVLRSDGVLFEVTGYKAGIADSKSYRCNIPSSNIEGLCFDSAGKRLLIGPKNHYTDKKESKNKRYIYSFDLRSKKTGEIPVFTFDMKEIRKFAEENHIDVPYKDTKKGKEKPDIEFRISELAINPVTNKLFVLSGEEQLLMVFDLKGRIEYMEKLDDEIYKQPEGLTFLDNGDMLISNESKNKKPTIVRCNYIKKPVK
jgi:hypothetical protein